jgi:hypothetical protein
MVREGGRLKMTARVGALVASDDSVFPVLCEQLLGKSELLTHLASVTLSGLLETVRRREPDVILLDIDGLEHDEARQVAAKLALVSDAGLVIASGYLAPGSPELNRLLQNIEAIPVLKPSGSSSLSLSGEDGDIFLARIERALEDLREGDR